MAERCPLGVYTASPFPVGVGYGRGLAIASNAAVTVGVPEPQDPVLIFSADLPRAGSRQTVSLVLIS